MTAPRSFLAPPATVAPAGRPPTCSVVIAAYQAAETVAEAIDSALTQTVPPHEVIVCDDGSTDGTADVLRGFGGAIRVHRQPNRGEAAAKNTAARLASGEFIVLLDADDLFLPERIEAMGELARARPDLDIITTDAWLERDGTRLRRSYSSSNRFEVLDQPRTILERNFVFGLAAVRRRRLLEVGGFDERIAVTTDWECWIRLILSGSRVGLVDEALAVYRLRDESLSAELTSLLSGRIATLRTALRSDLLTPELRKVARRSVARNRRELLLAEARLAVASGRPDARRRALAAALGPRQRLSSRAKCLLAAASPVVARRLVGSAGFARRSAGGTRDAP